MSRFTQRFENIHFEVQHILVLFIIVVVFQTALSFLNNQSTNQLFQQSMEYYRRDTAERIADLTTTALELQIERGVDQNSVSRAEREAVILSLNKLVSQQNLQRNVDEIYLLVEYGDSVLVLQEGVDIYELYFGSGATDNISQVPVASNALVYYAENQMTLLAAEQIISSVDGDNTFHVLVPFYNRGEIAGATYMRITPDVAGFMSLIESAYNQSGVLFTGLILIGFMAMFFIYSYTAQERDLAQKRLFEQESRQLREKVEHQKESLFTKRIYHTHHKAEKVMGFIKEDLRGLDQGNLDKTRNRVTKYANFISRVIYDMKSYDPPIHVIRNPLFQTDVNGVITFIVDNIFKRVYREGETRAGKVKLDLAEDLPIVHVNEYVIWEIIEPLIQNAIDHNVDRELTLTVRTSQPQETDRILIEIEDDGHGFKPELLMEDEDGVKALFRESISTKEGDHNSGYGCYLAREISRRCGWTVDAVNLPAGGASFRISASTG